MVNMLWNAATYSPTWWTWCACCLALTSLLMPARGAVLGEITVKLFQIVTATRSGWGGRERTCSTYSACGIRKALQDFNSSVVFRLLEEIQCQQYFLRRGAYNVLTSHPAFFLQASSCLHSFCICFHYISSWPWIPASCPREKLMSVNYCIQMGMPGEALPEL